MKAYDIAAKRKAVSITQQELAVGMGWGERTQGDIELGKVDITDDLHTQILRVIEKLAKKEVIAA